MSSAYYVCFDWTRRCVSVDLHTLFPRLPTHGPGEGPSPHGILTRPKLLFQAGHASSLYCCIFLRLWC
ncbi:uncharacterized protein CTRU02_202411 [Colletotrichum truncatum]|uniref:Uncharacterized protein n=1 Tax=Colletotrichum truncatum TaxID=5467 RepID=A0ACC3ZK71_COLTU|nr:uncharacterized protein CTRU02_01573 [Colletotrichum truncatum]KAF6799894.1 hypothetical protein CTRU02_01573 [Colletotrichum truncatum]